MSSNEEQRKLIFLVGPTGSGKSLLKETIIKDLENIGNIDCISVDDIFEKDGKSKDIFYKLYEYHFKEYYSRDENVFAIINDPMNADSKTNIILSSVYKKFKEKINLPINYNDYLGIIATELDRADIKNCVIPQIKKRYRLNNDELPFSQFTSAVYFALREKYLNKNFDERIKYCIDNKKDIIIESNGEHINSIIGWYQKTNVTDSYDNDECKTPSLDLRDKINGKNYEKHVYFLYRPVDEVKTSMISRAFINMNNFLNDKDNCNIPRLPEIEDDILNEKFQKICSVYKDININQKEYDITTLNVYNNFYTDVSEPSMEKNENEYKYCIPETEIKKLKSKYSVPAAEGLKNLKRKQPRKVKCNIIINRKGKLYNKLTKNEINSVPANCCCDNKEKPCTDGPCIINENNGGRGKKRKKYTQKKQRHFKTRRNYKPKKSRKKNTKKRNRKAKHQ